MRWIMEKEEVERILRDAKACVACDDNQQASSELVHLTFDCVEFEAERFYDFLIELLEWSSDSHFKYVVLDPDPISYFFAHFGRYPLLEISIDDPEEVYIAALNEDPGNSPADAVGTNWYEYVILPASKKWFIRGQRDARSGEGGHLWVPTSWSNRVRDIYPYQLY